MPDLTAPLDASVAQLCATDLDGLSVEQLQQFVAQVQRTEGRLAGLRDQALGALQARTGGQLPQHPDRDTAAGTPPVLQPVQHWWRDSARLTGQQAGADLRRAAVLRDLPVLAQAVTDGRLTPAQVQVLCRLHGKIALPELQASQPQLILVAAPLSPDALVRWVTHQIATHCEPALDAEQAQARDRRYLQLTHEPDCTVRGRFVLASEDAEALFTVLEPLARRDGLYDLRSPGSAVPTRSSTCSPAPPPGWTYPPPAATDRRSPT